MIFVEFVSRRRVLVKRVAFVSGVILAASLAGCSSQGLDYSDDGSTGAPKRATLSVPIPSEPVYGYSDNKHGARGPRAAFAGGQDSPVQRGSLAPVGAAPADVAGGPPRAYGQSQTAPSGSSLPRYASNDGSIAPLAGGSYAMQPVDAHAQASAPYAARATAESAKRYAGPVRGDDEGSGSAYQPRYDDYKPYRGETRERPERSEPYERASAGGERDYIVREGDTLFGIAQRYGMSTGQLAELNRLTGATIHPGQRLRVRSGQDYTAANKYKAPTRDEPRYVEREPEPEPVYDDERKAPPGKPSYRDDRYSSYDSYNKASGGYERNGDDRSKRGYAPKSEYAPKEEGRREEPYVREDTRYDVPPRPYAGDKPYAEKPYADKPWRAEKPDGRYASRSEEPRDGGREERYAPRQAKPKGSYYAYRVKPGETMLDVARRGGLSPRQLADYNDIPQSAPLYPGQVLHIPKGKVYEGARDEAGERERYEDPDERGGPRGREREGYAPRTPFSQNAPDKAAPKAPQAAPVNERAPSAERRFAKAEEGQPQTANDAGAAGPRAEPDPQAGSGSQPILAAHRDVGAGEAAPGAPEAEGASCENLLASPAPRSSESFREPVQGVITAKFGSKQDGSFNDGIDFSVPKGTPVKSAENGVVAYAGSELPGFGNLVLIRHADGFVTAYAHNDEILVKRCDVVKRGQVISKAGATGKVSQPQLHFELRKESKPVDPEGYFSRS